MLTKSIYLLLKAGGYRSEVVSSNLQNAFPHLTHSQIKDLQNHFYQYFSRLLREIYLMLYGNLTRLDILSLSRLYNVDDILSFLRQGRSVFLMVPHYGNWELGGWSLALEQPYRVIAVYKPLSNERFDKKIYKTRSRWGTLPVPMESIVKYVIKYRNEPAVFVFIADQNPTHLEACFWTEFMGKPVPVFWGPEKLAHKFNIPVFWAHAQPISDSYQEVFFSPIATEPTKTKEGFITASFMNRLENLIKTIPPYWLWSHRRWKHSNKFDSKIHKFVKV
ncbi:MAG: hypothetical protein GXO48_07115 [Chlorobi bacterium]|nr:hypothetical protein [Chlorobiota bacterium]